MIYLTPQHSELLLAGQLSEQTAGPLLRRLGLENWQSSYHTLQRLAPTPEEREVLAPVLPALFSSIAQAASPERVIVNLERLAIRVPNRRAFFETLAQNRRAVEILVTLIAGSQFLTEILLRNPEYFERLVVHQQLAQIRTPGDFYARAKTAIAPYANPTEQLDALRRFQRWQLLRLGTCDLLGLFDLITVTGQLSHLADSLVQLCLSLSAEQTNTNPNGFIVLGMGKLGGQELNYSSDIDLLFLADENASQYQRLGKRLIDALSRVTAEGFLYRVDMRLRPWGSAGALVTSVKGHIGYLNQHARQWEKQALLKARVIAGNQAVGQAFLNEAAPLIYAASAQAAQIDVREMKEKIEQNLQRQGRGWGEVKLGQGSIRDIEFIVQYLQLAHGDSHPQIRTPNTLNALSKLTGAGFLSPDEYRILANGYTFLRPVEHWLQMMHYRQTHTLPDDKREIDNLARRLGFENNTAGEEFLARYEQHALAIRLVYLAQLENQPPAQPKTDNQYLQVHLSRLTTDYASVFSAAEIEEHARLVDRLTQDNPLEVHPLPLENGNWQVTIVGYDYLGALSLICGLFFIYKLNILQGQVFSYRPRKESISAGGKRKLVDVFIVKPESDPVNQNLWQTYRQDLAQLFDQLAQGEQQKAQGDIAKRLALLYEQSAPPTESLYPIEIEIDNSASDYATLLHISTRDTIGFLYELTNALALRNINIVQVAINTNGNQIQDLLYITDKAGKKITDPNQQRELRAATALTKHFTHLLPHSPNPTAALLHFRQFLQKLFARPNWPDELVSLERPETLDALARLLGVSDFLWTDFFRMQYANLLPVVQNVEALVEGKSRAQLKRELAEALANQAGNISQQQAALNAFKDKEMFRIDMRHILGHISQLDDFSQELTSLAEVIVASAYQLCLTDLQTHFGQPQLTFNRKSKIVNRKSNLVICALGKCGGQEMGFASDIELMFIYEGNGQTSGPAVISTAEFYEQLVSAFLSAIQTRHEGVFEPDLRLRPYGKSGSLAVSLDSFKSYYAPNGPAWPYERQALVKLRPIAGDLDFGAEIARLRDDFVYTGQPFDTAAMRAMRERQVRHLVKPGTISAKHSPGALVDVEYLVQGLQITHGAKNSTLRLPNTAQAMSALHTAGILSAPDYEALQQAYLFLRRLINALRMVHGNAKDLVVPPAESEEFAFLARRLDYGNNLPRLRHDLSHHTAQALEISQRLLP